MQIKAYQDALDSWGLRDYQLQHTHLQLSYSKMLYIFLHGLVILSLASIPRCVILLLYCIYLYPVTLVIAAASL